jgi:hypothetical protein
MSSTASIAKPTAAAAAATAAKKVTLSSGNNDLIPTYKIFAYLAVGTVIFKVILQLFYNPEMRNSSVANPQKNESNFETYILYYFAVVWAIGLLVIVYAISSRLGDCVVSSSFINFLPIIFVILILIFIIYQNTNFYNVISQGKVPKHYAWVDFAVNALLVLQFVLIYLYINEQLCPNKNGRDDRKIKGLTYGCMILAIFSFVGMGYSEWILRTEITDG